MNRYSVTASLVLGVMLLVTACGSPTAPPSDESRAPDLVIEQLNVSVTQVNPGETVNVSFAVRNLGNEAALASTTRISINSSADSTGNGDRQLAELATPALAAGASESYSETVTIPSPLDDGTYYIWVTADVADEAGQDRYDKDGAVRPIEVINAVSLVACTDTKEIIDIPDANLQQRIRSRLSIAADADILCEDMQSLTQLPAQRADVGSLEGLQHAVNLILLDIYENNISSLAPLAGLSRLQILRAHSNQISSLAPLSSHGQLEVIYIEKNDVSDLAPLAGLTNLRELSLSGNQIADITPIQGLTELWFLDLAENNGITDLTSLSALSGLRHLDLNFNQLVSIAPLQGLASLDTLELQGTGLNDIAGLQSLSNLEYLNLSHNEVSELGPLQTLDRLRFLNLEHNLIRDIEPLAQNPGLGTNAVVYLAHNCLDLTDVPTQNHLSTLRARGATVTHANQSSCEP